MLLASVVLAALAVALAWPVPLLLARAGWPSRAPATALVLWQAIALAGGLSMIGSLLTFGLIPFGDSLIAGGVNLVEVLGSRAEPVELVYLLALSGGVLLGGHLVVNLVATVVRTERQRRRHRRLIDLLSSPVPDRPGTRLIDNAVPLAYCLPGTLSSVTVFSAGLVRLLSDDELRAVIAHERAHLTQRHWLVLIAFRAWHASLPWFPIANRAEREVGLLIEMLADDSARRDVDDRTLATAIALVAGGPSAEMLPESLAEVVPGTASPDQVHARVRRLLEPSDPVSVPARAAVGLAAAALLAVPTVLLLTPAATRVLAG